MVSFEECSIRLTDGYLAYGRFFPASDPRGAVLYHHGIQSHCGWYGESASRLVEAGYHVLQYDRRGSGRNHIDRGHAESARQLIADAQLARDELRLRTGFDRYHVVGASWGGRLAVTAYIEDSTGVLSLSLVTPGLFPLRGVSKEEAARIGFAMLYEPATLFDIPLNRAELFTGDEQGQRFFRTDELLLRQATAGFFLASRRMDKIIARLSQCAPVPVHLMLAGEEGIIDNEKTEAFARDLAWPATKITHYPGARHSLEFEPCAESYFGDLVGFIAASEPGCPQPGPALSPP